MKDKIKQTINHFLGTDLTFVKLFNSRIRSNRLINGLRIYIDGVSVRVFENKKNIEKIEKRLAEIEEKTRGVDPFTRLNYIREVNDLIDAHKKWLEVNGLVKAPTKA